MAKQTRIERQEKAKIESVSFDRFAADSFQLYVQGGDEGTGGDVCRHCDLEIPELVPPSTPGHLFSLCFPAQVP